MDNQTAESQQYQQQVVYQHYQHPQSDSTNPNTAYDASTQAYYASYYNQTPNPQQPQPQPDYSSYYYPNYSNSYQSQPPPDPNSIYPPGVTISSAPQQPLVQNHPDVSVYYANALPNPQQLQSQNVYMAVSLFPSA